MTQGSKASSVFTYDKVAEILKGYNDVKNRVMLLEYEIANDTPVMTGDDMIYQMAFSDYPAGSPERNHCGTDVIALTYMKKTSQINIKHKQELEDEVRILKVGIERIDYYINLLTERQTTVLKRLYFEGKTITEIALSMSISESTVKNARKDGIKKLVEMYAIITC
jgi:RNA polymerase sigma factor (sigma-70 family)